MELVLNWHEQIFDHISFDYKKLQNEQDIFGKNMSQTQLGFAKKNNY